MKRRLLVLMSVFILGTTLTGCNNDDSNKAEVADEVVEEKEEKEEEKEEIKEEKEEENIEDLKANAKYYDWDFKEVDSNDSRVTYIAYYFKEDGTPLIGRTGYRFSRRASEICYNHYYFSYSLNENRLEVCENHDTSDEDDVYYFAYVLYDLTEEEVNELYDLIKAVDTVKESKYDSIEMYYDENATRLREYCDSLYKEKLANNDTDDVHQMRDEGTPLPIE